MQGSLSFGVAQLDGWRCLSLRWSVPRADQGYGGRGEDCEFSLGHTEAKVFFICPSEQLNIQRGMNWRNEHLGAEK